MADLLDLGAYVAALAFVCHGVYSLVTFLRALRRGKSPWTPTERVVLILALVPLFLLALCYWMPDGFLFALRDSYSWDYGPPRRAYGLGAMIAFGTPWVCAVVDLAVSIWRRPTRE